MIGWMADLARPFLLALDAERAHGLAVTALKLAPCLPPAPDDPALAVEAFGLKFPNPVGLAAGFDKHADVPDAALSLGFGFVEAGGVTPLPQPGNPGPRVFRLPADRAVINRYGFNSEGAGAVAARLAARRGRPGIVGLNLGANKESADKAADFALLAGRFAAFVDFMTVNVSSPNTPGLRSLQEAEALDEVLARSIDARDAAGRDLPRRTPLLLKIAPDLADSDLDAIVRVARNRGVDGMIVSNTTVSRPDTLLDRVNAREAGGLSGRPLFSLSTRMLAKTYQRVEGAFPLIGVGGIDSPDTAWTKIEAGATLVQFYTAMIYEGPGLVGRIKRGMVERLNTEKVVLGAVVGRRAQTLADAS